MRPYQTFCVTFESLKIRRYKFLNSTQIVDGF